MKLFTKTFGCQMNFADSDELGRHFKKRGIEPTDTEDNADVILVNTCTVRDLAEHKAMSFVGRLKEWKQGNPKGFVVVTGCAAERAKDDFKKRFPFVDLVVGAKDIEEFPKELDALMKRRPEPHVEPEPVGLRPQNDRRADRPIPVELVPEMSPVIQYVTIMRGCNYNCTYCIVPSVRGREIYRPISDILKDVADRTAEGAKEIWLLGQTVNSYKPELAPRPDYDFADLLRDVCAVPGVGRIRFMSPHPFYLSPKLIQAMAELSKVCRHIHLPVQSGSNSQLQKMKRNYTREGYLRGVGMLRQSIPDITITTDIIVGFPGETEPDFQDTLSLVKDVGFDSAYCFKYSPRPGTASAEVPETISEDEKERRVNELLALTDNQGAEKAKSLIGSVQEVLIEQDKGEGLVRGKTSGAWRVRIQDASLKMGDTVQVKITGTHSRELHGTVII